MKINRNLVIGVLLLEGCIGFAFAQNDAANLTREGIALYNQKNYAGAVEKYKAALSAEPNYAPGNYQLAFALNALNRSNEALPYLEKVEASAAASANLKAGAYDLAGGIYDRSHQPQRSIESYLAGIKVNPDYQPLHYDLGLAYFRAGKYHDAEMSATEALRLDSTQAGSWRLYALVCFHQNKRAAALLGFCEFLRLEPNSARSAEAFGNIQHIIQGGVLKPEPGEATAFHIEANTYALNQAITNAVAAEAKRRYLMVTDKLTAQLQAIFSAVGELADKQNENSLFRNYLADWYLKLAQSPHLPTFAHLIRQSTDKTAAAWLTAHPQEVDGFNNWVKATARKM